MSDPLGISGMGMAQLSISNSRDDDLDAFNREQTRRDQQEAAMRTAIEENQRAERRKREEERRKRQEREDEREAKRQAELLEFTRTRDRRRAQENKERDDRHEAQRKRDVERGYGIGEPTGWLNPALVPSKKTVLAVATTAVVAGASGYAAAGGWKPVTHKARSSHSSDDGRASRKKSLDCNYETFKACGPKFGYNIDTNNGFGSSSPFDRRKRNTGFNDYGSWKPNTRRKDDDASCVIS